MKSKIILILLVTLTVFSSCEPPVVEEEPTTVTDVDGNVYNIVKIGNQYWMAENLKVTKFNNGDAIATTTPANKDLSSSTNPIYLWAYDGNQNNVGVYGYLYSWAAVNDARKLAPAGWHIPTDADWNELVSYLGGEDLAGGKMKEQSTAHWVSPNTGADNSSGFNAVPAGNRNLNGSFYDLGYHTAWWSATNNGTGYGNYRVIHKNEAKIFSYFYSDVKVGFSVRCIKD